MNVKVTQDISLSHYDNPLAKTCDALLEGLFGRLAHELNYKLDKSGCGFMPEDGSYKCIHLSPIILLKIMK